MSTAAQLKKVRQQVRLDNWGIGKRRTVDGVVYLTIGEARRARNLTKALPGTGMKSLKKLERRARMKKLHKETQNGRKEEDIPPA